MKVFLLVGFDICDMPIIKGVYSTRDVATEWLEYLENIAFEIEASGGKMAESRYHCIYEYDLISSKPIEGLIDDGKET